MTDSRRTPSRRRFCSFRRQSGGARAPAAVLLGAAVAVGFAAAAPSFGFVAPRRHRAGIFHPSPLSSASSMASSADDAGGDVVPATYPLSRRKAMLIEESSKIDGGKRGSYSPAGWSNRHGSVLTPASVPGVYTADRPFYWNKIDVGCRMTVIKLLPKSGGDGDPKAKPELFVHSPVGLDDRLMAAIDDLGVVAHVVSANYEHVKYAPEWARRYPRAKMWGCPGMAEREPGVNWTGEVPRGARPTAFYREGEDGSSSSAENPGDMWDCSEVQPLHVDTEANPFTGKPFFEEVIFYHTPSKTLLTTDLYWNYPRGDGVTNGQIYDDLGDGESKGANDGNGPWELAPEVGPVPFGTRAWKFGMDKLFRPFYANLMVRPEQKDAYRDVARFVIANGGEDDGKGGGGWDVETIIPAHGDVVRGGDLCRRVLGRHFDIRSE